MSEVKCPKCQALQARRTKQEGIFQKVFLQRLGYYPWQCRFCKNEFVIRNRGHRSSEDKRGERRPTRSHSHVTGNLLSSD
jgi:hypothetical protein